MDSKVIGLVGCGKAKGRRPCPARDLYTSALFRKSLALAERVCDEVFILSALHGLVLPDAVVEPYEHELTAAAAGRWAARVLESMPTGPKALVVFAGGLYASALREQSSPAERLAEPLAGLQIGERLHALNRLLRCSPVELEGHRDEWLRRG